MAGGLFWESGSGSPNARKFCSFLQKLFNFWAILIKNKVLKPGIEIGSANMIKVVA